VSEAEPAAGTIASVFIVDIRPDCRSSSSSTVHEDSGPYAMTDSHFHGNVLSSVSRRKLLLQIASVAAGLLIRFPSMNADETSSDPAAPSETPPGAPEESPPQPGSYTLGGMQFWGDTFYLRGYRIQQNVLTGHFRLLDANNRRYASGTEAECREQLERIRRASKLTPDTGHAIIYLHGIGRTSRSMAPIRRAMPEDGFTHVMFEYPSTRIPLKQSATYLNSVIQSLTDVDRISFVVHSMGGLVVRQYLKEHGYDRIHRLVMLGTPNKGAELADMLKSNFAFRTIFGPAGQELVTDEVGTIRSLPTPTCEFAVVAGGRNDGKGFNPLLPGDDDGTVTVESARLEGAADFLLVPKVHSFLMSDPTVIEAVRHFLDHGRFFPDRPATPIIAPTPEAKV
jgi:pimeloyl-ACP methyl ester carboxylesterase